MGKAEFGEVAAGADFAIRAGEECGSGARWLVAKDCMRAVDSDRLR